MCGRMGPQGAGRQPLNRIVDSRTCDLSVVEEKDPAVFSNEAMRDPGNPFLHEAWLRAFLDQTREPVYLRFLHGGNTVGWIGGLKVVTRIPFLKRFTKKLHFFTGPSLIADDPAWMHHCFTSLKSYAMSRKYWNLYIDSFDYQYDFDISRCGYSPRVRDEYIIDIKDDLNNIKRKFSKYKKRDLVRAEKYGITFHEMTGPEAIDRLVFSMERTKYRKQRNGLGRYSYFYVSYLNKNVLVKLLQYGIATAYCVRKGKEILSTIFLVTSGHKSYALLGGTNETGYDLNANLLLHWKVIERLKTMGVQSLNLGRVTKDGSSSGLIRFKTGIGAEKYVCTGGEATDLQGAFGEFLIRIHKSMMRPSRWTPDPAGRV